MNNIIIYGIGDAGYQYRVLQYHYFYEDNISTRTILVRVILSARLGLCKWLIQALNMYICSRTDLASNGNIWSH